MSCMISHMDSITDGSCREFLHRMKSIVFSDYRLIYKFVDSCKDDIDKLQCGRLDSGSDNGDQGKGKGQGIKVSSSNFSTY